ncbi:PREDICTED: fatty acyl-CoA reductase 1-like, partial [Diuraphis noxia]|uniref:fatty acyl-CoA reductase 1-like n=1 Tax=Diuraphis noxia TaxID=143948 RepID=UPI0007639243
MEGGDIFIQDFINDLQESPESQIQKCFRGSCILITGGTGFVGKVLIEKLLRSCRDLNTIYLIVRPLNGQNPNERVKEMFNSPFFDRMKIENPTYRSQVQVVRGDCFQPNIGVDEAVWNRIASKINAIIHLAAATRSDNHPYCTLHTAVYTNVRATRDLIVLTKRFKNLK